MAYKDFHITPVSDARPGYQMRVLVKRNGSAQLVTAHFSDSLELTHIDGNPHFYCEGEDVADLKHKGIQAIKDAFRREPLMAVWESGQ